MNLIPKQMLYIREIIKIGFESLQSIPDVNMKLNTNLKVQIGGKSSGNIIAGVFGTDKLLFDIIGDPINIASRIQNTGEPGKIHISEETKELINGCEFMIEERDLLFLKVKGKKMTSQVIFDDLYESVLL